MFYVVSFRPFSPLTVYYVVLTKQTVCLYLWDRILSIYSPIGKSRFGLSVSSLLFPVLFAFHFSFFSSFSEFPHHHRRWLTFNSDTTVTSLFSNRLDLSSLPLLPSLYFIQPCLGPCSIRELFRIDVMLFVVVGISVSIIFIVLLEVRGTVVSSIPSRFSVLSPRGEVPVSLSISFSLSFSFSHPNTSTSPVSFFPPDFFYYCLDKMEL